MAAAAGGRWYRVGGICQSEGQTMNEDLRQKLERALGTLRDRQAAEAAFREAIDVARGQQARLLELRAATSLAGLWGDNGRRGPARELLAPVYEAFTEGFDTPDLRDAKALLDALA